MKTSIGTILVALLVLVCVPASASSLYQETNYRSLTSDHKAFRMGDVLTILVVEDAVASTSAETKAGKEASISGGFSGSGGNGNGQLQLEDDFRGGGKIQRSGKLNARITVSVTEIADNGDLRIQGSQLVRFNDEKQEILIEGFVRPIDISPENTVLSSRISNAKISYRGKGILGEKQKPGFLTRFLTWLRII